MKKLLTLFLFSVSVYSFAEEVSTTANSKKAIASRRQYYTAEQHMDLGQQYYKQERWREALGHFSSIALYLQNSSLYPEALYFSGICSYNLSDLDIANKYFSLYLQSPADLDHFEEVLGFKYAIADLFNKGWSRHMFGKKVMPKVMNGHQLALDIYDEVIVSLSGQELAIFSLFGKAEVYRTMRRYDDCIETLKTLTHRHALHPLASKSFVVISEIYLEQIRRERQNPDFIALAELNLRHFRQTFPSDPSHAEVERHISEMRELYAESLYATAAFYERKGKPASSLIYYNELCSKCPNTAAAQKSRERLQELQP